MILSPFPWTDINRNRSTTNPGHALKVNNMFWSPTMDLGGGEFADEGEKKRKVFAPSLTYRGNQVFQARTVNIDITELHCQQLSQLWSMFYRQDPTDQDKVSSICDIYRKIQLFRYQVEIYLYVDFISLNNRVFFIRLLIACLEFTCFQPPFSIADFHPRVIISER